MDLSTFNIIKKYTSIPTFFYPNSNCKKHAYNQKPQPLAILFNSFH